MHTIPVKISPNPLVSVVFEVRFVSSLKDEDVLQEVFPLLHNEFPKLESNKKLSEYKKLPDYSFSNDDYSVSIGSSSIHFGMKGNYESWEKYSKDLHSVLNKLSSLNQIREIQRVGLRFINIFDNESDPAKIIKQEFRVGDARYLPNETSCRAVFDVNDIQILFQFHGEAKIEEKNKKGVCKDIDASVKANIEDWKSFQSMELINKLHTVEKELFFHVLVPSFLETLNPEYY